MNEPSRHGLVVAKITLTINYNNMVIGFGERHANIKTIVWRPIGQKLGQAREAPDLLLAPVGNLEAAKEARWQAVIGHKQGKRELALGYGSPSQAAAIYPKSDIRRSTRDQTETPNSANKSSAYAALV